MRGWFWQVAMLCSCTGWFHTSFIRMVQALFHQLTISIRYRHLPNEGDHHEPIRMLDHDVRVWWDVLSPKWVIFGTHKPTKKQILQKYYLLVGTSKNPFWGHQISRPPPINWLFMGTSYWLPITYLPVNCTKAGYCSSTPRTIGSNISSRGVKKKHCSDVKI